MPGLIERKCLIEKQNSAADVDPPALDPKQPGPSDGLWLDAVLRDAFAAIAAGEITAGAPFAFGCYEISGPRHKAE
jgi:hypothetical protein